jgi:hypothetical protein
MEFAMFASNRFLTLALLAIPLSGFAERLVPAGSLIQCTVSETKLSSKTVAIGDPVLCQVSRSGIYPSGTVLSGTFEDYKDPGHLVGKGWMELVFDRMIFPSNDIVPMDAKVISVPHYSVDTEGKILGKGHATRDTIEWLIPVLWPIDLINLPRRGPRPTLKNESRITIKVMGDLVVPDMAPTNRNQYGFAQRAAPVSYEVPPLQIEAQPVSDSQLIGIYFRQSGFGYVTEYWDAGHGQIGYRFPTGVERICNLDDVDLDRTIDANHEKGIDFHVPADYRVSNEPIRNNNPGPEYNQEQGSHRYPARQQYMAQNQGGQYRYQANGTVRRR